MPAQMLFIYFFSCCRYLASSMGQLNAHLGSLSMNKISNFFQLVDVIVRPKTDVLGTDSSSIIMKKDISILKCSGVLDNLKVLLNRLVPWLYSGSFSYDKACSMDSKRPKMGQME